MNDLSGGVRIGVHSGARTAVVCGVCMVFAGLSWGAQGANGQAESHQPTPVQQSGAPDAAWYKEGAGPYEVGEVDLLVLLDPARDKDLEVCVRYPKLREGDAQTTKFPLVVFSHGAGGSRKTFPELLTHWASQGYVVVSPTHSDSLALRKREGQDLSRVRENPNSLVRDVKPMDRVADVKFILDSLSAVEDSADALRWQDKDGVTHGRIDREKIAMAGHSAGALTTQMIVGVRVRGSEAMARRDGGGDAKRGALRDALVLKDVGDDRVRCGMIISGGGTNNLMMTEKSWDELRVPILTITGSNDYAGIGNETPATRRHSFEYSRGRDKGGPAAYLLWLEGATHSSYSGKEVPKAAAQEKRVRDAREKDGQHGEPDALDVAMVGAATRATTMAFLDAWLLGNEDAKAYLEDGARTRALTKERGELKSK